MSSDKPEQSELARPGAKPKGRMILKVFLYLPLLTVLIAVAVPNFVRARTTTCKNACVNILQQIDGAKSQYALEAKLEKGAAITVDQLSTYLKGGAIEKCPDNGTIQVGLLGENPTCSIAEHALTTQKL